MLCGALVAVGVYLILERSLSRIILGLAALGNGINILFLIAGGRSGEPPIVGSAEPADMADPLAQTMVLTAIVITLAMTGFLLAMAAYRAWQLRDNDEVRDDREDRAVAKRKAAAAITALEDGNCPIPRKNSTTTSTPLPPAPEFPVPTSPKLWGPSSKGRQGVNLNVLLAIPVVLPLLGAGILLAFPAKRFRHLQAFSAIGVLVIVLAAAIALLIGSLDGPVVLDMGGWAAPVGISLVADRLSTLMLVTSVTVTLVVLIYSMFRRRRW